jgi:hypothetical protein
MADSLPACAIYPRSGHAKSECRGFRESSLTPTTPQSTIISLGFEGQGYRAILLLGPAHASVDASLL